MYIEQLMSRPVASCRSNDTLHTAARLMWEQDCGALPVVNDQGKVTGIITDRDICMATYSQGRAPQDIPVAVAMATPVYTCEPADTQEHAEELMSKKQIRRLPVVDRDNRLVGMISLNDIARHGTDAQKKNGKDRDIVQTMAAICAPRGLSLQRAIDAQASASP